MKDWVWDVDHWCHAPWWKVAINTILRVLQPQDRKWVIYTVVTDTPKHFPPKVLGYGFGRVLHLKVKP